MLVIDSTAMGSQAIDAKHQIRDARLVVATVANAINSAEMQ